ncbi:unnamed protein product [Schistosoma mattheei]|uniref:Uncharacterized protein n=1 Tax=Schistosoma mattheei TaxID=31246 RepID=A0A183P275_9TREM|nr:unnamed protein product [Schistosoma mattheei]
MDYLIKSCESLVNPTCSIEFEKLVEFGLTGIVIREYQLQGINWLINCDLQNHGGLLCDEMGLGKTCQICINDEAFFKTFYWNYVIIDEGHRLKNSNTQLYSMLNETCLGIRFILTGTPVQNNLEELFNLLHFVAPNYFHGKLRSTFLTHFGNADKMVRHRVFGHRDDNGISVTILKHRLLWLGHVLRMSSQRIPRRTLFADSGTGWKRRGGEMSASNSQCNLFQSITGQHNNNNDLRTHNRLQNLIMNLRKCVNHPYLFDGIEPEPFTLGEHLIQTSSKLFLLDLLLQFLYNPNHSNLDKSFYSSNSKPVHKVLIFSQMTRMLDIIQDYMTLRGYSYERLDGSVRGEDRFQAVKSFNEDQETFVFLLSTRAGGQGLNLVSADTVIFVDNDFNPQIDVQAAGRAHRIGQTK